MSQTEATQTSKTLVEAKKKSPEELRKDIRRYAGLALAARAELLGTSERWNLFPLRDSDTFEFAVKQEAAFWPASEIDFTVDIENFRKLPANQQHLLTVIFGFFAPADGGVIEQALFRFQLESESLEEQAFYVQQASNELSHAQTYGFIIDTLFPDRKQFDEVRRMIDRCPAVGAKTAWMSKYIEMDDLTPAERYFAAAIAEGFYFIEGFAIIFWFRSCGKLPGIIFANEQISKDESLHCDFNIHRCKTVGGLDHKVAQRMVAEAVAVSDAFIDFMLPKPIEELNAADTKIYARTVMRGILDRLEIKHEWAELKNPYVGWTTSATAEQRRSEFEVRGGNYSRFNPARAMARYTGQLKVAPDAIARPEEVDF